jgi:hypothetical protein
MEHRSATAVQILLAFRNAVFHPPQSSDACRVMRRTALLTV